jgi:hypothetical protein
MLIALDLAAKAPIFEQPISDGFGVVAVELFRGRMIATQVERVLRDAGCAGVVRTRAVAPEYGEQMRP